MNHITKYETMIGNKYGTLTVLDIERPYGKLPLAVCKCSRCGKTYRLNAISLRLGYRKGCPCMTNELISTSCSTDLTGKQFGRWTVLSRVHGKFNSQGAHWLCKCSCSNGTVRVVKAHGLVSGTSKSCGCLARETATKLCLSRTKYKTEFDRRLRREYDAMKDRAGESESCKRRYPNHAGRGIRVCNEWKNSFDTFKAWAIPAGYKIGLTLERDNNDKNYCPENCRWIPRNEQNRNTRLCRRLIVGDVTDMLQSDWIKMFNQFKCWIKKQTRLVASGLRKTKYTNNEAEEYLRCLIKFYADELLAIPTTSVRKIVDILKKYPRSVRFITVRGKTYTVAKWRLIINEPLETMLEISELDDTSIVNVISRKLLELNDNLEIIK